MRQAEATEDEDDDADDNNDDNANSGNNGNNRNNGNNGNNGINSRKQSCTSFKDLDSGSFTNWATAAVASDNHVDNKDNDATLSKSRTTLTMTALTTLKKAPTYLK